MNRSEAKEIIEDILIKGNTENKPLKDLFIDTIVIYENRLHQSEVDYINLSKDLTKLRENILDFMMGLDRNKVEIPVSMYDDWNNLESILDD